MVKPIYLGSMTKALSGNTVTEKHKHSIESEQASSSSAATEVPTRALDAYYYTDPNHFAKEQRTLLSTTWQFVAHQSELANAGDYVCATIGGQDIFCISDKHQNIRAFYNVCQHRAHQLVNGHGNTKLIVCPYHAWTYQLDGQLRSGPNIQAVPGLDKTKICLSSISVEIFCGFVFVNLDTNAKAMDDWFGQTQKEINQFAPDLDRLKPIRWVNVSERCNWKVSVENYSECYHCQKNHPTFSSGVVKPETYNIQPQDYCLRHTTECQNLDSMSYPIDIESHPHAGEYSSWFLWPMFSFQVYPGNLLNTYHWRAVEVDQVEVWRGWYSVDGTPSEVIENLAEQDRDTTVAEDIHLVESVQRGLNSRGYKPGPLVIDPNGGVKSEHSIAALHRWMREPFE